MNLSPAPDDLRNQLVDQILSKRPLPAAIERALRTVRRDLHLPGLAPALAYSNKAISIKDNPGGPLALSCASVPSVVAMMLAQLDAQLGDHVLEIGAGTGYNAALLAELVGPNGQITTLDVHSDVALHARTALNETGYEHVRVIERDGLKGAPEYAPYNRMIGTVGFWDLPSALWQQLAEGGRLVVPLRWRGQTRSVALTRHGDTLVSHGMELCGFIPIVGQDGEMATELAGNTIRIHHDDDQDITADLLTKALTTPATDTWSDVRVGREESFDGIWLRATATDPAVCRIEVTKEALDNGVRRPVIPGRTPTLVTGDSLAYLIAERDPADTSARPVRLGAASYGPDGPRLARNLIAHIAAWNTNRTAVPRMTIYPASTPTSTIPAARIVKSDSVITLSYQEN